LAAVDSTSLTLAQGGRFVVVAKFALGNGDATSNGAKSQVGEASIQPARLEGSLIRVDGSPMFIDGEVMITDALPLVSKASVARKL
jgi:hypothetical protein